MNSIHTIAISAVNRDGSVPLYGEFCPGVMATAYSRDAFGDRNPVVSDGTSTEMLQGRMMKLIELLIHVP